MKTMPIQNCNFEVDCPRHFDQLAETSDPNMRFCDKCSRHVYRCNSLQELTHHSQAGHCVSLVCKPCTDQNTRPGDVVRITSGVFENFDATIESLDKLSRSAEIIVRIIGRVTPMWVSLDTLGHIDD
jgi:transcription antitermination factor NusG